MKDCNIPAPAHARYHVTHVLSLGYVVRDPDGNIVGKGHQTHFTAERQRDQLQRAADIKAKRGPRACICCGSSFESQGIHNRMCTNCRGRVDALGETQRPVIPR